LGQVEVIEQVGVTLAHLSLVLTIATMNGRHGMADGADWAEAREQALTIRFIRGTNDKHEAYLTHLRNSYLEGNDCYAKTLYEAYHILQRREPDGGYVPRGNDHPGLAVVSAGNDEPKDNGRGADRVICFECGKWGHIASDCPKKRDNKLPQCQEGTSLCMNGVGEMPDKVGDFLFSQSAALPNPTTWILLDNQYTVDLFRNFKLLKNIRQSNTRMSVQCNAGPRSTNMVGDFPGYVWYDPHSIAIILSLKRVASKYRVESDNAAGGVFIVTKPDGTAFAFCESSDGLYYLDTEKTTATVLVNTVAQNNSKYTNDDYLKALQARALPIIIGRPSTKQFIRVVTCNQLPNCHATKADILATEDIFEPDVGSLKGITLAHL
jgi:hypothetical protein